MKKQETAPDLDISGLLSLKQFERPDAQRTEKNIQNIMRTVRATNNVPSLLVFPDKSFAWMFAQPRYGIAALFILFLGMNMLNRPAAGNASGIAPSIQNPGSEIVVSVDTNRLQSAPVPGITPPFSVAGDPEPLSSYIK